MTVNQEAQYESLSSREGFNRSLRHFKFVSGVIGDLESKDNLADLINESIEEKEVQPAQIKPMLSALLVDRYGYHSLSYNVKENIEEFSPIVDEVQRWTTVDLVVAYYSPELGLTLVNPKNPEHWTNVRVLKKFELITIYCGAFEATDEKKLYSDALEKFVDLLEGKKVRTPSSFTGGRLKFKRRAARGRAAPKKARQTTTRGRKKTAAKAPTTGAVPGEAQAPPPPEQQAAPASTSKRMTPLYGITVTNELFHNGNVEAWKKIIESYHTYHPGLKVLVFYDGERINDLNTLFKWGKVKRGTAIMIAVAGDNIRDVAKLQKYLRQGAGPMFEAFLKGHPNKVLQLF